MARTTFLHFSLLLFHLIPISFCQQHEQTSSFSNQEQLDLLRANLTLFSQSSVQGTLWKTILNSKGEPLFESLQITSPVSNQTVDNKFQPSITAIVTNVEETVDRNSEFSFCYRSYDEKGLFYEECGLNVFGIYLLVAKSGRNRLECALFHQMELIWIQAVEFNCCISDDIPQENQLISQQEFEIGLVRSYIQEILRLKREQSHSSLRSPQSPLGSLRSPINSSPKLTNDPPMTEITVLIGIKSFALNIEIRKAIRETWFQFNRDQPTERSTQINFYPFFLIGDSPFLDEYNHFQLNSSTLRDCLQWERLYYHDVLLGQDLDNVIDSYHNLPQKILQFFHWIEIEHKTEEEINNIYTLILDDDVYLNTQEMRNYIKEFHNNQTTQTTHSINRNILYAGEVLESRFHHKFQPIRDSSHLNYLNVQLYPFSDLPPFALGNCYLLSGYLSKYFAQNYQILKPIGTLEDLSIGFWLLSLQVTPIHLKGVCELKRCVADLNIFQSPSIDEISSRFLAVAGLRLPSAYREIHEAIIITITDHGATRLLFDGKFRTLNESTLILNTYYRNIYGRLNTVRDQHRNLKPNTWKINRILSEKHSSTAIELTKETTLTLKQLFNDTKDSIVFSQSQFPTRVLIYLEIVDKSVLDLQHFDSFLQSLAQLNNCLPNPLTKCIPVEFEILLGTQHVGYELLNLIRSLFIPIRYFEILRFQNPVLKDCDISLPENLLVFRYLSSFDTIWIPTILMNETLLFIQTLKERFQDLQELSPIHSFLPEFKISNILPRTPEILSSADLFSFLDDSIQHNTRSSRFRKLEEHQLSSYTALVESPIIIFGPNTLYLSKWVQELLHYLFPSHVHNLQQNLYQIQAIQNQFQLRKVLSVEKTSSGVNDWSILRNRRVYFVTSFLDCAGELIAGSRQLSFVLQRSTEHLHMLYQILIGVEINPETITSFWVSGEPLVGNSGQSIADDVVQDLSSLSWLNGIFISQYVQSNLLRPKLFYLSTFATSFTELQSIGRSPISLLQSPMHQVRKKKFPNSIAYLYYRCDRKERELLFTALSTAFPQAVSLGRCNGAQSPRNTSDQDEIFLQERFGDNYNSKAIMKYDSFQFVVAVENIGVDGYITEKLTNAFLAHSIPIYKGALNIEDYFNSSSFINCNNLDIEKCVQEVEKYLQNTNLIMRTMNTVPIKGENNAGRVSKWLELFYWHEDARDTIESRLFILHIRSLINK